MLGVVDAIGPNPQSTISPIFPEIYIERGVFVLLSDYRKRRVCWMVDVGLEMESGFIPLYFYTYSINLLCLMK